MTPDRLAGFPPKVFLIGAQKAGTTFLGDLLAANPAICLATPKEPDFFTRHYAHGWDWYQQRFRDPTRTLVDASTSYTQYTARGGPAGTDPARRIHAAAPDARLIYLLRDPVRRAFSAYLHARRYGEESRPFSACLSPESPYVLASRYAFQLEKYLEVFPRDQILLLRAEALFQDPRAVLDSIDRFLGLVPRSPTPSPEVPRRTNAAIAFNPLGQGLVRLFGKRGLKQINAFAKRSMPPRLRTALKHSLTQTPPEMTGEELRSLHTLLAPDIARLRELSGIDVTPSEARPAPSQLEP